MNEYEQLEDKYKKMSFIEIISLYNKTDISNTKQWDYILLLSYVLEGSYKAEEKDLTDSFINEIYGLLQGIGSYIKRSSFYSMYSGVGVSDRDLVVQTSVLAMLNTFTDNFEMLEKLDKAIGDDNNRICLEFLNNHVSVLRSISKKMYEVQSDREQQESQECDTCEHRDSCPSVEDNTEASEITIPWPKTVH